ncbi:MAG: type I CRISPR-associated protein Cas7 [Eubacteriaceae bacterium]
MSIKQNSDFIYLYQATLSNMNGDPDQENKPRMDYETSIALVSDNRRKRDIRDFLKKKGYKIFVDTLAEQKVPMDKMFYHIRDNWLEDNERMDKLLTENTLLNEKWKIISTSQEYKKEYDSLQTKIKNAKKNDKEIKKIEKELISFNNIFLTEIIKRELIDIRLFGSAMAVGGITKTYTGPIQINWGYSLHPVEIVKSNTITSIMNDDSSTFGKKYKLYYAMMAHYGTINKYNAKLTVMTEKDREIFRKAIVQSLMNNKTDSKQGQEPVLYFEIIYKKDFDGYLGDLRRFIDSKHTSTKVIRNIEDISIDFKRLNDVIFQMKEKGYIEKVIGWKHPFVQKECLKNMPAYENIDLWEPIEPNNKKDHF